MQFVIAQRLYIEYNEPERREAMEKERFDKIKYNNRYIKENKDRINFVMPKGHREKISAAAAAAGISSAEFIRRAIDDALKAADI